MDPAAPVPELTDEEIHEAGLDARGEYVWGWRTAQSQHYNKTHYELGGCYEASWFSIGPGRGGCHPGIYLAGKAWLKACYGGPLVRCYCRRGELVHDGDKWRAKRLWIVEE